MVSLVKYLSLLIFVAGTAWAGERAIEIVVGGKTYTSMDDYRTDKLARLTQKKAVVKKPLIKGFKTITVPIPPTAPIAPQTAQVWRSLGVEDGLSRVQIDFRQSWQNPVARLVVKSGELEDRLTDLAEGRTEPLLLMVERNKLRVMALEKDRQKPQNLP